MKNPRFLLCAGLLATLACVTFLFAGGLIPSSSRINDSNELASAPVTSEHATPPEVSSTAAPVVTQAVVEGNAGLQDQVGPAAEVFESEGSAIGTESVDHFACENAELCPELYAGSLNRSNTAEEAAWLRSAGYPTVEQYLASTFSEEVLARTRSRGINGDPIAAGIVANHLLEQGDPEAAHEALYSRQDACLPFVSNTLAEAELALAEQGVHTQASLMEAYLHLRISYLLGDLAAAEYIGTLIFQFPRLGESVGYLDQEAMRKLARYMRDNPSCQRIAIRP